MLIYSAYIYQHHFHKKKKKNCMLFKPRNQHANWIFFQFSSSEKQHAQPIFQSMFSSNCKLLPAHIFQHIQVKFSPYFPATITCSRTQFWEQKRSRKPVLNHYSLIKTVFKPAPPIVLVLIYSACIYQHHFHKKKKTSCYSNQEINMQTGIFF